MTTNYPASCIKVTFEISLPPQQISKFCSYITFSQNLIRAVGGARFGMDHVLKVLKNNRTSKVGRKQPLH